jgi:hypothetical protein
MEDDYRTSSKFQSMSHVFERSPATFAGLGEEDLRQHLLVPLNGHYFGQGTGETFNNKDKSDILIRVDDRNIFVAECKIWSGEKKGTDAIDQLLGYLTWRDTKAALIIFSKAKDFTAMLKTLWATVEKHPNLKCGLALEGETRRRYTFKSGTDADRNIILTVLAFNFPQT